MYVKYENILAYYVKHSYLYFHHLKSFYSQILHYVRHGNQFDNEGIILVLNIVSWCVEKFQSHYNLGGKKSQCQPLPPPVDVNSIQLNNMQHALNFILFWGKCAEDLELFVVVCLAPYIKVMKMGMVITCANVQNQ